MTIIYSFVMRMRSKQLFFYLHGVYMRLLLINTFYLLYKHEIIVEYVFTLKRFYFIYLFIFVSYLIIYLCLFILKYLFIFIYPFLEVAFKQEYVYCYCNT